MTERAKSSDDHCSRFKMCLGWPMEPIKRNERHILKKSKIMHVYYLIVFNYYVFYWTTRQQVLLYIGHGLMGKLNPCTHLAVAIWWGINTWTLYLGNVWHFKWKWKARGDFSPKHHLGQNAQETVENIYLYWRWEAWHGTLVPLLPVNIQGGGIFRWGQQVIKHYDCEINKCSRKDGRDIWI